MSYNSNILTLCTCELIFCMLPFVCWIFWQLETCLLVTTDMRLNTCDTCESLNNRSQLAHVVNQNKHLNKTKRRTFAYLSIDPTPSIRWADRCSVAEMTPVLTSFLYELSLAEKMMPPYNSSNFALGENVCVWQNPPSLNFMKFMRGLLYKNVNNYVK